MLQKGFEVLLSAHKFPIWERLKLQKLKLYKKQAKIGGRICIVWFWIISCQLELKRLETHQKCVSQKAMILNGKSENVELKEKETAIIIEADKMIPPGLPLT